MLSLSGLWAIARLLSYVLIEVNDTLGEQNMGPYDFLARKSIYMVGWDEWKLGLLF